ncbi:Crp/Fnr family transcriptional regulator [Dethiobacter alkaliphilus]|uniref:Transcriptional regulator, Crp/Fnr family n=1 Tax=Dethiobacter alkaliphilus AHT 1 TaxID=555088 RepID=C0GFM2_DETAL|nr:Crp/Fnr family transcriptional regulator [Dethiobacter alkaliphilus]EEG77982.1 transcriptional regulator, Crp/Fnr family [Dethiobacter alkaliphilus AHT 1]MCW3488524.1 Crp/Fnr family transcriptional regulator [Dethiobacter alkaliphilus]
METDKRFCLHDLPLFDNLERSAFSTVCRHAAIKRHIRRGETLFHQGDPSDTLYLIKEGSFKLVRITEEGREVILHLAGCGEVLAEAALFREGIHPVSAVALEDARVCALSRERMEEVIQNNPDLALQVIYSLGSRLYNSWEQAVEIRAGSTQEKVLNLFIRLANEHGENCSDGTRIPVSLTQQEIADFVGASRVMVARALKTLSERNYVLKKGRYYILKDRCF